MKRIAKFHKVSFEQFKEGWIDTFGEAGESEIQKIMMLSNCRKEQLRVRRDMISIPRYR